MAPFLQTFYPSTFVTMARKAIKKEPVAEKTMSNAMNGMDNGQLEPVSSGATQATVVDEDVVMHTDLAAANHRSGFAPSSADQIGKTFFPAQNRRSLNEELT